MSRTRVSVLEVIRYMKAYEEDRGIGHPLLDGIHKDLESGKISADDAMESLRGFRILDSFQVRRHQDRRQAWMSEMVELKKRVNPQERNTPPFPKGTGHDYAKAVQTLLAEPEIAARYSTFWIKNAEGVSVWVHVSDKKGMALHAEGIFDIIMGDYIKEINEAGEKREAKERKEDTISQPDEIDSFFEDYYRKRMKAGESKAMITVRILLIVCPLALAVALIFSPLLDYLVK